VVLTDVKSLALESHELQQLSVFFLTGDMQTTHLVLPPGMILLWVVLSGVALQQS